MKETKITFYDDYIYPLLVSDNKPTGGAAVQALAWVNGLVDIGIEVNIITSIPNQKEHERINDILIFNNYDHNKGIRYLRWLTHRLPSIYRVVRKADSNYLYHGVPSNISGILAIICFIQRKNFILRVSNDFLIDERILLKRYNRIYLFLFSVGFKLANYLIVQNNYQYTQLRKKYKKKKIYKIPNPFSGETIKTPIPKKHRFYIAWLGLFQFQKNLPFLYEIAKRLPDLTFKIAGLIIDGADGTTLKSIESLIGLPNVEFIGLLERSVIQDFLGKAICLLNTSHFEGLSNTFLEAFSTGTPVVCPFNVDPDNVIKNFSLGESYKNLYEAIHCLEKFATISSLEYKKISDNCIAYVVEKHNKQRIAHKLISVLK